MYIEMFGGTKNCEGGGLERVGDTDWKGGTSERGGLSPASVPLEMDPSIS
jgi:hypothetical protein